MEFKLSREPYYIRKMVREFERNGRMKQYCKYCVNAVIWGDCHCLCEVKEKVITEASASKVNHCKNFELNEMSVFDYNQIYKPRYKHEDTRANDGTQLGLDILAELGGKA